MTHTNLSVWRLFVVALEVEAKQIIEHYKLLQVTNRSINDFGNLIRKQFGNKFHNITEKFHIYVNPQDNNSVALIVSGVGKVSAAAATSYGIMTFNPSVIINIGMCGTLKENIFKRGHIVRVASVIQHDMYFPPTIDGPEFDYLMTPINLRNDKFLMPEEHSQYTDVILATGDSFVDDEDLKLELQKISDIVDMEGYSVANVCEMFGINLEMYKVVSDGADNHAETDFRSALKIYNESVKQFLQTF